MFFAGLIVIFVILYHAMRKIDPDKPVLETPTEVARSGASLAIGVVLMCLLLYIVAISPVAKMTHEVAERTRYEQRLDAGRKDAGR